MKHTAMPWFADGIVIESKNGNIGLMNLARPENESKANAAFIVKACNMHEELVALLKEALDTLNPQDGEITTMTIRQGWPWSQKVRALLAKTKVSE